MNSVYDCCLLWVLLTSDSAEIVYMMDSVRLLFLPFQFAFFFLPILPYSELKLCY